MPTDSNEAMFADELTRAGFVDEKSGKGMAKGGGSSKFPKSDFKYWESKIYKPTYTEGGERKSSRLWTVRLAYGGRRASLPLGLAHKREAAQRAAEIYRTLVKEGWDHVLEKYRPKQTQAAAAQPSQRVATVGELIAAAAKMAETRSRSQCGYAAALRHIAAGATGLRSGKDKTGLKREGAAKWRAKVDDISLSQVTDAAVQAWKLSRNKAAATGDFFIKSPLNPREITYGANYRCDPVSASRRGLPEPSG